MKLIVSLLAGVLLAVPVGQADAKPHDKPNDGQANAKPHDKPNDKPNESQAQLLREAQKSLLRVVVVYRDQSRYVQSALFHAGRTFDLFGTDEQSAKARQLYARLISDYPSSPAAAEAKRHL